MCPARNHGVSALFPVQEEAEEIHLSHLSVCRVCGARAGKRDGRVRLRLRLSHVEFVVERKHCSSHKRARTHKKRRQELSGRQAGENKQQERESGAK